MHLAKPLAAVAVAGALVASLAGCGKASSAACDSRDFISIPHPVIVPHVYVPAVRPPVVRAPVAPRPVTPYRPGVQSPVHPFVWPWIFSGHSSGSCR